MRRGPRVSRSTEIGKSLALFFPEHVGAPGTGRISDIFAALRRLQKRGAPSPISRRAGDGRNMGLSTARAEPHTHRYDPPSDQQPRPDRICPRCGLSLHLRHRSAVRVRPMSRWSLRWLQERVRLQTRSGVSHHARGARVHARHAAHGAPRDHVAATARHDADSNATTGNGHVCPGARAMFSENEQLSCDQGRASRATKERS